MAAHLEEAGIAYLVAPARTALLALEEARRRQPPVTRLVVEGDSDPASAGQLLKRARDLAHPLAVKGLVLISPLARDGMEAFRREGFTGCLVRPVRPQSIIAQLSDAAPPNRDPRLTNHMSTEDSSRRTLPQRRVLLAEDNAVNQLLATRILEKAGCDVVAVSDGEKAVTAVREVIAGQQPNYGLILMDMQMPVMDGQSACRAIRALFAEHPALTCPPIVAVTANAFAEDRANCLAAGMDDYLAKPFDRADLEALLTKWASPVAGRPAA